MVKNKKSQLITKVKIEKHPKIYWYIADSYVMARRSIRHITRSVDQLMSVAMFPIMFMLLNRYVLGGAISTGDVTYANYLFAGILTQTLAFGANYTTINLAFDLKQGIIDRLRSLPMNSSALIVGHVAADLLRNMISGVIVIVAGFLVGFRPTASLTEWVLVFALATLFSLAISSLSAILGLFVKSIEAAQWIGFVFIFPLTFVSSAFVPTSTMPKVLRVFAENQPVTHVINTMRAWLVGTDLGDSGYMAFAWCVGIILVSAPLATFIFRRREQV